MSKESKEREDKRRVTTVERRLTDIQKLLEEIKNKQEDTSRQISALTSILTMVVERLNELSDTIKRIEENTERVRGIITPTVEREEASRIYDEALNFLITHNLRDTIIPVSIEIPVAIFELMQRYERLRDVIEVIKPLVAIKVEGYVFIKRLEPKKASFLIWLVKINKFIRDDEEITDENIIRAVDDAFMGMALRVFAVAFHPSSFIRQRFIITADMLDTNYDPIYSWNRSYAEMLRQEYRL
jgi:hypothetical protein